MNTATQAQFEQKEAKLLKYIVKIVQSDRRLFDLESALLQNCSKKLLAKNPDLKTSFNTLISGDIANIKSSYACCKDLYKSNGNFPIFPQKKKIDIEESDYSDKVKLTKLMEIADTHRCLSYKEISDLMKVKIFF
jgi:hypothetical protein